MELIENLFKRTVLMIVLISVLITFLATPASYAKLELEDGEFYYAGTTDGAYVPSFNIFAWLINCIGDIADWILGIITMAPRMVVVGWTALIEKLLTWAIESTTGVTADGSIVDSSTDMSGLNDSSNNITVEAIVYNKVAGLNIDFFELEMDATTSGTGKKLICDYCEKPVEECIPDSVAQPVKEAGEALIAAEDEYNSYTSSLIGIGSGENELRRQAKENLNVAEKARTEAVETALQTANCGCNGCDSCVKYLKQLSIREPLIIKLRMLVAIWYSVIRFLAMAAMLVVLIAIGIKMATSTIASDKAVYKRMLVDWIVGVIILFAIHYFMIFCIHMNGVIVKTIEESAQSINQVQMQQMFGDEEGISNSQIEVKVYEEVRTRAYDPRLINGMTGMIMYVTLVFFAFKYTIIYLKRYLTILVLTLMGPGVGVAYALQKALSGKSSALSTWMKEYIMNVIIQIVHALLYAVFISQAMMLSLQSVAGIAFALILMNYVSKADELFKKIFDFGGGDSLLGHTENAMQSTVQGLQTAKGLVTGAKPIMNLAKGEVKLAKAGIAGAVGLGTGAVAGATAAVKDIAGAFRKNDSDSNENTPPQPPNNEGNNSEEAEALPPPLPKGKRAQRKALQKEDEARLMGEGGTKLRQDVEAAKDRLKKLGPPPPEGTKERKKYDKEKQAAQQQHLEALEKYSRFQKLTNPSTAQNLFGKLKRSVDMENVFETTGEAAPTLGTVNGKPTFRSTLKHIGQSTLHGAKAGSEFMNGRTTFNPRTMSFENSGTKGILNMHKNFAPSNFFAFTDADKEKFKKMDKTMRNGLLGMGSMLLGMGMFVEDPSKGMALMAAGYTGYKKAFKRDVKGAKSTGKYTFSGFGSHSLNTIKNSALVKAKQEHDAIVAQGIRTDFPSLAEKLQSGEASAITIGELSGELGPLFATKNSPYSHVATMAMKEKYNKKKSRFMKNTGIGAQMDDFAKHYSKQKRKQMAQFIQEATDMEQTAIEARIEFRKAMLEQGNLTPEEKQEIEIKLEEEKKDLDNIKEILKQQGYDIDAEGDIIEVDETPKKEEDIYAAVLLAAEKDLERYKSEGSSTVDASAVAKKYDIDAEDIVTDIDGQKITQKDIDVVNRTIDNILMKISQGQEVDLSSESEMDGVIKLLEKELVDRKVLPKELKVEALFKQGSEGLKAELKKKAQKRNSSVQATKKKLEEVFTPKGADAVIDVIEEIAREKSSKGKKKSEVSVRDVLGRLERTKDGALQVKSADGSIRTSVKDGSRSVARNDDSQVVGGKLPIDEKQLEALEQFMQVTRASTPTPKGKKVSQERRNELIEDAAKTARERKLQQAMLAMMSEEPIVAGGTETTSKSSAQDILAQLTQREADYVTASVRDLLELKELNAETARLNRDKVKGPKAYVKAVKNESDARIAVASLEREIILEEARTDTTRAERKSNVGTLKEELTAAKAELQKQEASTMMRGPVVDIPSFVRSGFKNDTISELMGKDGSKAVSETRKPNGRKMKRK